LLASQLLGAVEVFSLLGVNESLELGDLLSEGDDLGG
jgi:hypothetical protein